MQLPMRKSVHDPDCGQWLVHINGWPTLWGRSVMEADAHAGTLLVAVRDEQGELLRLDQAHPAARGYEWVDGTHIVVEQECASVTFEPMSKADPDTATRQAFWQGVIDRAKGISHWGRMHYGYNYDLRDAYDAGYRSN